MNKELRKAVETELATRVREVLEKHHPAVAAEISKQIREGVKFIAKKFVKHLPGPAEKKVVAAKKKAGLPNKSNKPVSKKGETAKKTAKKSLPAKKKPAPKVKSKTNRK